MSTKRGLPTNKKMRHTSHYVDELSSREGAPIGQMIPVDHIQPNPDQPRKTFDEIEELALSVSQYGILEPILVSQERPRKFKIISGERRFRAAQLSQLTEIPCIVMDISNREQMEIALVENLQRKDLTVFEESEGIAQLIKTYNYTHQQIAEKLSKSRTTVTEMVTLASMSKNVRKKCQDSNIYTKSTLLEIARLKDEPEQLILIDRVNTGLNRDEVRKVRKESNNNGGSTRPKPFVFKVKSNDKSVQLQLKFKKSDVSNDEIIDHLEQIISELRSK